MAFGIIDRNTVGGDVDACSVRTAYSQCGIPDTRSGMEIQNVSETVRELPVPMFSAALEFGGSVRALVAKNAATVLSRKEIDKLTEHAKGIGAKGLAYIRWTEDTPSCSFGKFLLYLILIFNIATYFGVKESSVAALLGTAGVTIGLALQGGLENLAGGVMLLLFKPFQVGDYIIQDQSGGTEGTVYKIEMFYTTLTTVDNKHVIIPNGRLSNSTIINVTAQALRKLEIKVGISYDSDIKKAKKLLQHILQEDPGPVGKRPGLGRLYLAGAGR